LSVIVVVTRLRLCDPQHRKQFLQAAAAAIRQANSSPGILGTGVLPEAGDVYWTRTVWSDRASVVAFTTAEPHRSMMGSLDEWCDEASFVEWEQPTPLIPEWQVASERLVRDGRSAALSRPSADHQARSFPAIGAR